MKRTFSIGILFLITLFAVALPVAAQDEIGDGEFTPLIFSDGILALLYPTGWTYDDSALENNTLVFFNQEAMQGRPADAAYAPGEASIALSLIPTDELERYGLPSDSPQEALFGILRSLRASETDASGSSRLISNAVNIFPATATHPEYAQASFGLPDEVDGSLYLWAVADDLWALMSVNAAPGELDDVTIAAQTMLQSLIFDSTVEAVRSGAAQEGAGS